MGELAHRQTQDRRQGVVVGADPERGAGRDQVAVLQAAQPGAELLGCGQDQGVELVERLGAGLAGAALHHLQRPQRLDRAVVGLRGRGRVTGLHRAGRGDRVDHVGLAVPAADLPVRAADLDHAARRTRPGAGPGPHRRSRCPRPRPTSTSPKPGQPGQQRPVARSRWSGTTRCPATHRRWSRAAATWKSRWVSTPPVTNRSRRCHRGHVRPCWSQQQGGHGCGRRSDRTGTGLLQQAPTKSLPQA